jgi:hypothetical protein
MKKNNLETIEKFLTLSSLAYKSVNLPASNTDILEASATYAYEIQVPILKELEALKAWEEKQIHAEMIKNNLEEDEKYTLLKILGNKKIYPLFFLASEDFGTIQWRIYYPITKEFARYRGIWLDFVHRCNEMMLYGAWLIENENLVYRYTYRTPYAQPKNLVSGSLPHEEGAHLVTPSALDHGFSMTIHAFQVMTLEWQNAKIFLEKKQKLEKTPKTNHWLKAFLHKQKAKKQ